MNVKAQEQMIIGALCIDEDFRYAMFDTNEQLAGTHRDRVVSLLEQYGAANGIVVDPSIADHLMNVVAAMSPCRVSSLEAMARVKAAVCPCWPC